MMKIISKSIDLAGRTLTLEVGRFASLANAAVIVRYGDTMVLVSVVSGSERPELGYFPLTVEYIERLYAGGRIKGSRWVKREGRPSDEAILTARLVDRSIRPLFPKNYFNEVQIIITILSVDSENDPDTLSIIATSAALAISDIPWNGPVAGLRVGYINNLENKKTFIINPVDTEMAYSDLDLVISGKAEAIVMVEAGAKETPEEIMLQALSFGQKEIAKIIDLINSLVKEVGRKKVAVARMENKSTLRRKIEEDAKKKFEKLLSLAAEGLASENSLDELKKDIVSEFANEEISKAEVLEITDQVAKELTRKIILDKGLRPDGRKANEIRSIEIEVGILPRTHGSAMFKRGETQALTIVTLGAPSLKQYLEFATGEETKRYIHHYNMPPYSTGETGRLGWPARREIGHGALAERALLPVIPTEDKFPYTIRVVSEIMASNGSTSMASVCGSTLALMDAGVPLKEPVAGIAMGLITTKNQELRTKDKKIDYIILSDIIGFEDFFGDMDFKVAGTKNGITALQLDVKIPGLTLEIFEKAFAQAKIGRLSILKNILAVLPTSRGELSKYAPRVSILHIEPEKIGELIGPGGKMIRKIIAETGATVDVEDDGTVSLTATDPEAMQKAVSWVNGLTKEVKPGEIYEGEVKRIQPFGVFVEVLPGKEGLVHVSQMAVGFVSDPAKIVQLGQKVKVRVVEIDELGRINLSMLFGKEAEKKPQGIGGKPRFRRPFKRPFDQTRRW